MKITVKKMDVEVEGDAGEIAEALPSVLGLTPASSTHLLPAAPAEVHELEPAPCDAIDDVVLPHEQPDNDDAWEPVGGPPSPMPTRPFDRWQDIPADRLVWNATKQTAHVTKNPLDPNDLFCSHLLGMPRRGGGPVVEGVAKVCQSCNRHIGIEARP